MARNYFKIPAIFFKSFLFFPGLCHHKLDKKHNVFRSYDEIIASQQPVHDETFSRLHALFRSFKT